MLASWKASTQLQSDNWHPCTKVLFICFANYPWSALRVLLRSFYLFRKFIYLVPRYQHKQHIVSCQSRAMRLLLQTFTMTFIYDLFSSLWYLIWCLRLSRYLHFSGRIIIISTSDYPIKFGFLLVFQPSLFKIRPTPLSIFSFLNRRHHIVFMSKKSYK